MIFSKRLHSSTVSQIQKNSEDTFVKINRVTRTEQEYSMKNTRGGQKQRVRARVLHINSPSVAFSVVEWTSNVKGAAINFANRSYARSFVIYLEIATPINVVR